MGSEFCTLSFSRDSSSLTGSYTHTCACLRRPGVTRARSGSKAASATVSPLQIILSAVTWGHVTLEQIYQKE